MKHRPLRDVREAVRPRPDASANADARRRGQMVAEICTDVDVRAPLVAIALDPWAIDCTCELG